MITTIGDHRVQRGNVMDGISALMEGDVADFVYSDPPWGQGNLKYWQTMNNKMTGAEPVEISFEDFLPHYFSLLQAYAKDVLLIEYGVRWRDDLIEAAGAAGFQSSGTIASIYGSKSKSYPLDIHVFSKSGTAKLVPEFVKIAGETMGFAVVKAAFEYYAPSEGIVLDPMCGMGFTAQAAIDRGMTFRGNELNEKRLAKTIARLEKSIK